MLTRGRLALGVLDDAGTLVPEGDGLEVAALLPDCVGVPPDEVELADPEGAIEPDGAVPAPVPGRTW
jgi:hypothetical protein